MSFSLQIDTPFGMVWSIRPIFVPMTLLCVSTLSADWSFSSQWGVLPVVVLAG